MHKSRLCAFVFDCQDTDPDEAARFWAAALGKQVAPTHPDPQFANYRQIETRDDEPMLLIQKVDHESRIHMDIEADDLEAEVARLEQLGAKRVAFVKRWWVMQAPTGQKFCVVNPQRGPIGDRGTEWP
jgi:hypothetical protein